MSHASKFLLAAMTAGAAAVSAHASEVDFCQYGEGGCTKVWIENESSALVKSVDITEQHGDDSCNGGFKLTQESNKVGGGGLSEGASFAAYILKKCRYKFKFKTTSGCTGDKTQHLEPEDMSDGYEVVRLTKACGTLDAKKAKNRSNYG
mgnify:FL=1